MFSICLVLLFAILTNANINNVSSITRIYSNLAEVIQPLDKLPLEFLNEDWNNIRSDSITLIGEDLNITSQTITEKKKLLNGEQIYIRSPLSSDQTSIKLIKAILVNEDDNLVKFQDQSIAGQDYLYHTVPSDHIHYLNEPPKSKFYVNFTYVTRNSKVFTSYLQTNINWKTQYQLNLYDNESDLIVMANIRNDGKSSLSISQAELIGGDINLQAPSRPRSNDRFLRFSKSSFIAASAESQDEASVPPSVEQGTELAGLYVFPIKKPFTINAKTNYLLPMFRPHVSLKRYASISKYFTPILTKGKAQRSYRLQSDRFLSQGNCIIRENDRIVGETVIPNLAANDKHEFSLGEDSEIFYKENVTLISSKTYNETKSVVKNGNDNNITSVVITTRTQSVYNIQVELKNFKNQPVNIEYEQTGLQSYQTVQLTQPNKNEITQDGSTIKSNLTLKANTTENFSYTLTLLN